MAIIDNLQKISDTVWELPSSYKEGMRVPARIIATEKLVREMEEAVYQSLRYRANGGRDLEMTQAERRARMKRMRRAVRDENVFWWVDSFLRAGAKLAARSERVARRKHVNVAR